jgi:RsmE family RNA methyltransferase
LIPRELIKAKALVFVKDLEQPELAKEDLAHLKVLRLGNNDKIALSDYGGNWAIFKTGSALGSFQRLTEVHKAKVCENKIAVAVALVADPSTHDFIRRITELGVDEVYFYRAGRSNVSWDKNVIHKKLMKFRLIAKEACMQSRRLLFPEIRIFDSLTDLLRESPFNFTMAEPEAETFFDGSCEAVCIGPEGGFTNEELALVINHANLGSTVKRTYTAALYAVSLMAADRYHKYSS